MDRLLSGNRNGEPQVNGNLNSNDGVRVERTENRCGPASDDAEATPALGASQGL